MCNLRDGLILSRIKGLLLVVTELDVLSIINVLYNVDHSQPSIYSLIEDYRDLIQLLRSPTVIHVYKEVDIVTDFVAKTATKSCNDLLIFKFSPKSCNYL